jgi:ankyrin repeat protein
MPSATPLAAASAGCVLTWPRGLAHLPSSLMAQNPTRHPNKNRAASWRVRPHSIRPADASPLLPSPQNGKTALHLAAAKGQLCLIDKLLDKNADIDAKDEDVALIPMLRCNDAQPRSRFHSVPPPRHRPAQTSRCHHPSQPSAHQHARAVAQPHSHACCRRYIQQMCEPLPTADGSQELTPPT